MITKKTKAAAWLVAMLLAVSAPLPAAADDVPQTTPEGLVLLKQTRSRIVWAAPGASLEQYSRVALIDCYVAFEKDWQKDYNRDVTLDRRVSSQDMEEIKVLLAEEFRKIFTEELTEAGHEVVDHTGDDVMIIRPALINLEVTAPDVSSAFTRVITESAGEMTLYMEFYDSVTGALFARILDAQADDRIAQQANRVTNRAAARRILQEWARELAGHLGEVKGGLETGE